MSENKKTTIYSSFKFAFKGIFFALKERNFRIHLFFASCAIILGILLNIELPEWIIIFICIGTVLAAELFNTCIEKMLDFLHPENHHKVAVIKDIAAAAVLILAIISAIAGIVIYTPYVLNILNH